MTSRERLYEELRDLHRKHVRNKIDNQELMSRLDDIKNEIYPRYCRKLTSNHRLHFRDIHRVMRLEEPLRTLKTLMLRNV